VESDCNSDAQSGENNMNAAKLEKSDRLQRTARFIRKSRRWVSTMEIIHGANVCAVNSIVSELRANGMEIPCKRVGSAWFYRWGA